MLYQFMSYYYISKEDIFYIRQKNFFQQKVHILKKHFRNTLPLGYIFKSLAKA